MKNTFVYNISKSKRDRLEIEVGDSKQENFFPQVKIKRFDNEFNVSIRYIPDEEGEETIEGREKHIWKKGKAEAHMYKIDEGFEIEAILNERPKINVVKFSLRTKGVVFYYQPELTEGEKKRGVERPENVIGSYAVYSKEKKRNVRGGKRYRSGKIGHIYRPKITDKNGKEVWGKMDIQGDILTVTIPQDFLDSASYPVVVDPTFGYSSSGATGYVLGDETPALTSLYNTHTASAGDILKSISFFGRKYDISETIDVSLYRIESGLPSSKFGAGSVNVDNTTYQTWTASMGDLAMTEGHVYGVAVGGWTGNQSAGEYSTAIKGDSASGNYLSARESTEQSLPSTWDHDSYIADVILSLYATFERAPITFNYAYTIFIDKANP